MKKLRFREKYLNGGKEKMALKNGVQRPSYKKIFSTPPKYLLWKLKNVLNQRISFFISFDIVCRVYW